MRTLTCHWDVMYSGNRREPLNAGGDGASWWSLLVLRVIAVSSERCAPGTVLLLLGMEELLLLLLLVLVEVISHSAVIPNTILLVVAGARARSSPGGLHGHLVGVGEMEEKGRGRSWGLRRRAGGRPQRFREAPRPALAETVAPESSAPLRASVL